MLDLRPWISKNSKKVTSRPSNNKTGRARESKILKKFNVVNMINISACNEGRTSEESFSDPPGGSSPA